MIKSRKCTESKIDSNYSNLWKDALELALEEMESNHLGDMNNSEEMYFRLTDKYREELSYEGFAAFCKIKGDSLVLNVVYPEPVSVLSSIDAFLVNPEKPEIDMDSISSDEDKEEALAKLDEYIDYLKEDKSALKDWVWSDESVAIAEEMVDKGRIDTLEIELPDTDYIEFDEYEDEDSAILDAMKEEVISALDGYISDVANAADDVISDARIEISNVLNDIADKIDDAEYMKKKIERLYFMST